MSEPDRDLLTGIRQGLPDPLPSRLAVAVSGGGDSLALLHLIARAVDGQGVTLRVATVDHGLRPEVAEEIRLVARLCDDLGLAHDVLTWDQIAEPGNLQDRARRARYDLLTGWARDHGMAALALGHTADDQAETLVMRLSRSAGVTGLAGIPPQRREQGVLLIRPLLTLRRARLRRYLQDHGIAWAEDPSNHDTRFDRVRARAALEQLAPLGVTTDALVRVARNMADAEAALAETAGAAARDVVSIDAGDVLIARRAFLDLPDEIARRPLLAALRWITGDIYPPRRIPVAHTLAAITEGRGGQLAGCRVLCRGESIRICREFNAVRGLSAPPGAVWDGRWRVTGPATEGAEIRALGRAGLARCPDWRDSGRPHAAILATPAVWSGTELLAAPLAGLENGWHAALTRGETEYHALLLSH